MDNRLYIKNFKGTATHRHPLIAKSSAGIVNFICGTDFLGFQNVCFKYSNGEKSSCSPEYFDSLFKINPTAMEKLQAKRKASRSDAMVHRHAQAGNTSVKDN
jgi:hypothetical protein